MEGLVNARAYAAKQIKSFPAASQLTHCRPSHKWNMAVEPVAG
jgi:hypothetical protein